ncbi:glycoside hydrolase family 92 protein [Acidipila sp. EB88]|nr:glycoside hydrolase family 92 protein [Acidipila sp. EB88]
MAAGLVVGAQTQGAVQDRAAEVNPFIGTANGGNVFPGATMPFGMVQFSPEASPISPKRMIAAPGGYEYRATQLRGFSLTNVEGWGCAGGSGDVPLMPTTRAIDASPSKDFRTSYAAGFTHADEKAVPGSYEVRLADGVQVKLAAGLRSGAASFAFPEGQPARVLVRTSDSEAGSTEASTQVDVATGTVRGSVRSGNFCGYINEADRRAYYTVYFVAHFDRAVEEHGAWKDTTLMPGAAEVSGGTGFGAKGFPEAGHGSGVWLGFGKGGAVHVRVGISYVSEANAEQNLAAESTSGASVDEVAAKARAAWNKRLGQIAVEGGTADQRTVFSTALYHALQTPTTYSDVNGQYRGMDGAVHQVVAKQGAQYANFSGWDVYRSQLQLVTWLDPAVGSDIAQSLLNQSVQDGGRWDRWTHMGGATHVMNGDPAAPAIADIWAFGGRQFDAKAALASLVRAAEVPTAQDLDAKGCPVECPGERPGLDQYLKLHYIPLGAPAWGAAADTLEDATADFGISALAGHLGDAATQNRFVVRAQYWKNIWNPRAAPDGGYFMDRNADGSWPTNEGDDDNDSDHAPHPFTPGTGAGFVEGTAAQYVWMVPFNEAGLFATMGGMDKARARLDKFFYDDKGAPAVTNAGPLHAELNNEPSVETPWLYDFAGEPWKTQQLVRQVLDTLWTNTPKGIPGNDDLGEMSSWGVFAMMGLYPEIPGRAEFVLGSPLFDRVVVHRAAGDVRIEAQRGAQGDAAHAFYVDALLVDGKPSSRTWLPEQFALKGGTLRFVLSAKPNAQWGTQPGDAPPSFGAEGAAQR